MGHARGQLAHCLKPLHLTQRRFDPLALLDLGDKLPVSGFDLAGPRDNSRFQGFIERAQINLRTTRMTFTLAQRFKSCTRFVLPAPPAQGGLHHTDEGRGVERPFQKGDVAQRLHLPFSGRISFQAATALGEQHEGKVRP